MFRLTKRDLRKLVSEAVKKVLHQEQYMSDEDIAKQYSDMEITYFEMEPYEFYNGSKGWDGVFELEFPNADGGDYSETMINNFTVFDEIGEKIRWDYWLPDNESKQLKEIIRKEIRKRLNEE